MKLSVSSCKSWMHVLILVIVMSHSSYAQDTISFYHTQDTIFSWVNQIQTLPFYRVPQFEIRHSASKEDSVLFQEYATLMTVDPTEQNHIIYAELAATLWHLNKIPEAERMLLHIVNSKAAYYTKTVYHSSGAPVIGYGSFTSNYQNEASRYLAQIYIERQEYKRALKYVKLADRKYKVAFTCGTGHRSYREEIDGLYNLAYEGLGKYKEVIKRGLPNYDRYNVDVLVRAMQNMYTQSEIDEELLRAEASVECVVDNDSSYTFSTAYDEYGNEVIQKSSIYISGTATMWLFGQKIRLTTPALKDGEVVSKKRFLETFRKSYFYQSLVNG